MKIGLVADSLDAPRYGAGNYAYNLVNSLLSIDKTNEYTLIHLRNSDRAIFAGANELVTPPVRLLSGRGGRVMRQELWRVRDLRRARFDVIHEMDAFVPATPFLFNLRAKKVITVFDWSPFLFPERFQGKLIYLYRFMFPRVLRRAAHIVTISESAKLDIVNHVHVAEGSVTAIPLGIDQTVFRPSKTRLYDFPYIMHAGSEHPMKNLEVALEAFANLKKQAGFGDLKFIRVGGARPEYRARTLRIADKLGLGGDVVFANYVSAGDLAAIYSHARLLVFPSLYEGFGLPVLEAMACGTPVVASNAGSLPEVVGDAGITVNPRDVTAFTNQMQELLSNNSLRDDLVAKGLERARGFTWEKTARETLRVYDSLVDKD